MNVSTACVRYFLLNRTSIIMMFGDVTLRPWDSTVVETLVLAVTLRVICSSYLMLDAKNGAHIGT